MNETNVKVVARMTIVKRGSSKLVVEIHSDASFNKFYRWYAQEGRKRKTLLRTSQRNDGLHYASAQNQPGLEVLAARLANFSKDIVSVTIKVLQKRMYKNLLSCRPEELGAGMPISNSQNLRAAFPTHIPSTYTPMQKRMNIIAGAK